MLLSGVPKKAYVIPHESRGAGSECTHPMQLLQACTAFRDMLLNLEARRLDNCCDDSSTSQMIARYCGLQTCCRIQRCGGCVTAVELVMYAKQLTAKQTTTSMLLCRRAVGPRGQAAVRPL